MREQKGSFNISISPFQGYWDVFLPSLISFPHHSNHSDFKCHAESLRCFAVAVRVWSLSHKSLWLCRLTSTPRAWITSCSVCLILFFCMSRGGESRGEGNLITVNFTQQSAPFFTGHKIKRLFHKVCIIVFFFFFFKSSNKYICHASVRPWVYTHNYYTW